MTRGQAAYVGALVAVVTAVVIGSLFLPMPAFFAVLVTVFVLVELFRKEITPKGESPRSPLQILEQSFFWRAVAVAYTLVIVLVVAWHLGVERLSFFDSINLPVFLLLILGSVAGPIAVHVGHTYRMLGGNASE